jgi:hypothetical protein
VSKGGEVRDVGNISTDRLGVEEEMSALFI